MGNSRREKKKKKKTKEDYENERRQIELEVKLIEIQQKRLALEQKRIQLELKKIKLGSRKKPRRRSSKTGASGESSLSPIRMGRHSTVGESDEKSTTPTESTQPDFSDGGGNNSSSRFSGGESDGEEQPQDAAAPTTNTRLHDSGAIKVILSPVPTSTRFEEDANNKKTDATDWVCRWKSDSQVSYWANEQIATSSKRTHSMSMRNLSSTRPSVDRDDRASSLRDLLATAGSDASKLLHDSCSGSTETFGSVSTFVTSNVSGNMIPMQLNRGKSYPSLTEDFASQQVSNRTLSTGDLQNGEFVYTWPDGRRYEGSWMDGKFHGLGVHTWPNGGKYVGQYRNGLKHGYGVYDWADGSKYEGQFVGGKRNGQGTQINMDGLVYHSGLWRDDEPIRTAHATTAT